MNTPGVKRIHDEIIITSPEKCSFAWTTIDPNSLKSYPETDMIGGRRTPYLVETAEEYTVAFWREFCGGWDWECNSGEVIRWAPLPERTV